MSDYIRKQDVIDLINGLDSLPWEEETKEIVDTLPTLDEKEIIRKAFERVLTRLEELKANAFDDEFVIISDAIEIVKEECGISE